MFWLIQAPPAQAMPADPGLMVAKLENAQAWGPLADYFETLTPTQRGAYLGNWLKALQKAQRWSRLLEVCDAVIPQLEVKTGPKATIARIERAQALSGLERHGEAELAHEENGKLGYAAGFFNACVEARNARDWMGLDRCASEILASTPANAQALAWKGEALARQERFTDAEPTLRQALQTDPAQAEAWNNLGRCLNAKQAYAEAKEALDKSINLAPNEWEARYNRGLAEFRLGQYDESLKDLRSAAAANPADPQIRKDLAEAEAYVRRTAQPGHRTKSH